MRRRSNLLVALGIAFFAMGATVVYLVTRDDGEQAGVERVTVVIATQDLAPGARGADLVAAGQVEEVRVEAGEAVAGALSSAAQLEGATLTQPFAAGQQLVGAGLRVPQRPFEIPAGHEAVAIEIDFYAGGAGYVEPGDRINLYGLISTPLGAGPVPRAELLLNNVGVLDVDTGVAAAQGAMPAGADPAAPVPNRPVADTIMLLLALTPEAAERVVYMTEFQGLYASILPVG